MSIRLDRRGPTDSLVSLTPAFVVREAVFVDEQGVSRQIEYDGHDREAIHVIAFAGSIPVGTARLRIPAPKTAKFERLAVRKDYRNQGIGKQLFSELELIAQEQECTEAYFHAQRRLEEFYGQFGYTPEGEPFEEAGIPHIKMRRSL